MSDYLDIARRVMQEREKKLPPESKPLESVLKGLAIELWSDAIGERFWLVADEEDAAKVGQPRGTVYTAAEARRIIQVGDPKSVAEIHNWKRLHDAILSGATEMRTASTTERKGIPD